MTKRQIIDAILQINRTAKVDFLAGFSEQDLLEYLQHLETAFRRDERRAAARHALVA